MSAATGKLSRAKGFLLGLLCVAMPFSIAADDFASILLSLLFLMALMKGQVKIPLGPLSMGLGLFLIGFVFAALFGANPAQSFAYSRNFWRFLLPFAIFWALAGKDPVPFFKLIAYSSLPICLYALVQYFTGIDWLRSARLQSEYQSEYGVWHALGAFSHHLTFGGVCLLLFGLFAGLSLVRQSRVPSKLFAVAALANLIGLVLSLGRSVWIGTMVAVLAGALFLLPRRIALLLLALLVATGFALAAVKNQVWFTSTLKQTSIGQRVLDGLNSQANKDRLLMWKAANAALAEHPFMGLGPASGDALQPYYERVMQEEHFTLQHKASVGVHNLYLQSWIDFGLIGLAGLLIWWFGMVGALFYRASVAPPGCLSRGLSLGIACALLGSLAAGFFENNFRDGEVQTVILFLQGVGLTLLSPKAESSVEAH